MITPFLNVYNDCGKSLFSIPLSDKKLFVSSDFRKGCIKINGQSFIFRIEEESAALDSDVNAKSDERRFVFNVTYDCAIDAACINDWQKFSEGLLKIRRTSSISKVFILKLRTTFSFPLFKLPAVRGPSFHLALKEFYISEKPDFRLVPKSANTIEDHNCRLTVVKVSKRMSCVQAVFDDGSLLKLHQGDPHFVYLKVEIARSEGFTEAKLSVQGDVERAEVFNDSSPMNFFEKLREYFSESTAARFKEGIKYNIEFSRPVKNVDSVQACLAMSRNGNLIS